MTCPCDAQYRISVTVYDQDMRPFIVITDVAPRSNHRFTRIELDGLAVGSTYTTYTYVCISQGTLLQDDCSPPRIDKLPVIC